MMLMKRLRVGWRVKMTKIWDTVCLTCRDEGKGKLYQSRTENQAKQIKYAHMYEYEGHKVRVQLND